MLAPRTHDAARDVVPDMAFTTEEASDIAAICRRLEGVPLARLAHDHAGDPGAA